MSNSTTSSRQRGGRESNVPRALVHKKILDTAESRPDASMEEIADDVSGVTTSIVEKVLEEYGDPAEPGDEGDSDTDENANEGHTNAEAGEATGDSNVGESTAEDGSEEAGVNGNEPTTPTGREGEPTEIEADDGNPTETDPNDRSATEIDPRSATEADRNGGDTNGADREDPIETVDEPNSTTDRSPMNDQNRRTPTQVEPSLEPSDVTEKQLETLEEIRRYPEATQAELADNLGVSSATISQRVNGIDGFDWSDRREFVTDVFERGTHPDGVDGASRNDSANDDRNPTLTDGSPHHSSGEGEQRKEHGDDASDDSDPISLETGDSTEEPNRLQSDRSASGQTLSKDEAQSNGDDLERAVADSVEELTEEVAHLTHRIGALEGRLPPEKRAGTHPKLPSDPELLHKVLYACLRDDHVTEAEELRILKAVVGGGSEPT
ncbi:winged helix-turn-helix transcriptional regulator [Natrarchaeobius sp. A-rgal3]|uniref:winged helix-turn-helix transcriptional regulator n=1 Tax=Natrarchaeobius versutus TaxID=1679078 RepID=UPI00350FEAD6